MIHAYVFVVRIGGRDSAREKCNGSKILYTQYMISHWSHTTQSCRIIMVCTVATFDESELTAHKVRHQPTGTTTVERMHAVQ